MDKEEKREEIRKKILTAGGNVVHVVGTEEEIDMIAAKGQFFDGETSIVEGGKAMFCHSNSLAFYLENKEMRLCTGYAASKNNDGEYMWVNHSWCIDTEGVVHECTPYKREKYYGAIMDEIEAERFRRGIDYEYAAECKRKEEAAKQYVEPAKKEEKGIKAWLKRIIKKFTKKEDVELLNSASEPEPSKEEFSENLAKGVNEEISYSEKVEEQAPGIEVEER